MKIFRYEVPADGQVHEHLLSGQVLQVGCRQRHTVEFWAAVGTEPLRQRYFRAFGTGHEITGRGVIYHGTVCDGPHLVWHLFEAPAAAAAAWGSPR